MSKRTLTRRTFLAGTGAALTGLAVGPAIAQGMAPRLSPMDRLNIAGIGVGGQGHGDLNSMSQENIVALCDVDEQRAGASFNRWPDARRFSDFRRMLDEMANEIDAVVVSTPDHTHAVAALAAMQLGKHVYVQKPLTHSIEEARALRDAAHKYGVVTQMGNQGMGGDGVREACESIWGGALGDVHTVHLWTDRPVGWWEQGIDRPEDTPSIPDYLDWDLWLGPAPERPYHPAYHPFAWRGWFDFGTGALGDIGAHQNAFFMAMRPGSPTSVEVVRQEGMTEETFPNSSVIRYEFPAREGMVPFTAYWYDGGEKPSLEDLPEGFSADVLEADGGTIFVGTEGTRPGQVREGYENPPEVLPRSPGHYQEFIQACKGGPMPWSNFDYAAPVTETVLLGNVALRAGEKIEWDGEKVTNIDGANEYLHREYRDGWSLTY